MALESEMSRRKIDQCLRMLNLGQFLKVFADWSAIYLLIVGVVILLVKLRVMDLWPGVLWLFAGLVPIGVAAWFHAKRSFFSRREAVAYLDERLQTGGLLMTLEEQPDLTWQSRLDFPLATWRDALPGFYPKRFLSYVQMPALFALAACVIPLRELPAKPVVKNDVAQEATSELKAILETLKEEKVVEGKEEETLNDQIEKLVKETESAPLTHEKWETVEALKQQMLSQLQEMAVHMAKSAAAAEALESLNLEDLNLSAEQLEQLQNALGEGLKELAKSGRLAEAPPSVKELAEQLQKSGQLKIPGDPGKRQQLLSELKEFLQEEAMRSNSVCENCQGKGMGKKPGGKAGQGEGEGEGEGEDEGQEGKGEGQAKGNRPGKGGTSRGRGDAELTWGVENEKEGIKFKETVLPPGFKEMPKEEILRLTKKDPEADPAASAPRDGSRDQTDTAGSQSWNRSLKPRHQQVIRDYFKSDKLQSETP